MRVLCFHLTSQRFLRCCDLGKILERIEQNLNEFRQETNRRLTQIEIAQARLEERLTGEMRALDERLTGEIKTVNAKLDGLGKRLENQEFLSRSVMVGLILAFAAGLVKLFFPDFPGNP
jgi:uncharacterized protein YPO0396